MKHKRGRPSNSKNKPQSIGKTIFPDDSIAEQKELLIDLMSGERVHMSFDIPLKLRKAFKTATRQNKQTMCPVLQDFVMVYVAATRYQKECFNNTLGSVVSIENLVIPSYERLKFRRQKDDDKTPGVFCEFRECSDVIVGKAVLKVKDREYAVCSEHLAYCKSDPLNWKVS
jgi:hypothetical protein